MREDFWDLWRLLCGFHLVEMDFCETESGKLVRLKEEEDDDDDEEEEEEDDVICKFANVAAILLIEADIMGTRKV